MARKKQAPEPTPPEPLPPEPPRAQLSIINLKGTEAYRAWLAGFTKATHIPAATLVRLGLADLAKKHGHEAPPEK